MGTARGPRETRRTISIARPGAAVRQPMEFGAPRARAPDHRERDQLVGYCAARCARPGAPGINRTLLHPHITMR